MRTSSLLACNPLVAEAPARILPMLVALSVVALAGTANAWEPAFPQYRLWERFWQEYETDRDTLGLFHFNQSTEDQLDSIEDGLSGKAKSAGDGLGELEVTGSGGDEAQEAGLKAANASPQGKPARIEKPGTFVDNGRFGGGLRLEGDGAALVFSAGEAIRKEGGFAVEAWIRAEQLGGPLFRIRSRLPKKDLVLASSKEGDLVARIGDKTVARATRALQAGQWRHVAFVAAPSAGQMRVIYGRYEQKRGNARPVKTGRYKKAPGSHPPRLTILVDGDLAATHALSNLRKHVKRLRGTVTVGGAGGLSAVVDELRVSRKARRYYTYRLDALQSSKGSGFPRGQPYLRDAKDELLHSAFDSSPTPKKVEQKPSENASKARFGPGVHDKGMLVGEGMKNPHWKIFEGIDARSLTLTFWLSPHDWDNGRYPMKPEGNAQRRVRKYRPKDMPHAVVPLLGLRSRRQNGESAHWLVNVSAHTMWHQPSPRRIEAPALPLQPGRWYHVAVVLDHGAARFYLNGKRIRAEDHLFEHKDQAAPADHELGSIVFGPGHPWKKRNAFSRKRRTWIDEARLFRRPLTPPEIENAYERYRPDTKLVELPFAYAEHALDPVYKRLITDVTLLSPERDQVDAIALRLTDQRGTQRFTGRVTSLDDGRAINVADGVEQPTRAMSITERYLNADGETLQKRTRSLERPERDPGEHASRRPFTLRYYPSKRSAHVNFEPPGKMAVIRSELLRAPGGGMGLRGRYYGERAAEGTPRLDRRDPEISFEWPGRPAPGVSPDYFGVRWRGALGPVPFAGPYTVRLEAEGRARLALGGERVLNTRDKGKATTQLTFEKGELVPLRLHYAAGHGKSGIALKWRYEGSIDPKQMPPAGIRVRGPDGDTLVSKEVEIGPHHQRLIEIGALPEGVSSFAVRMPGGEKYYDRPIRRQHFVWEGNKLGVTKRVYPPFEPLEVEDRTVKPVMRRYMVGGLGLWEQVAARGNETDHERLLSGPIRLRMASGEALRGDGSFKKKADHEVVYEGSAAHPAVSVRTRTETEYDGCMRVELTLEPGTDHEQIDGLTLEIPLRNVQAPLWHVVRAGIRGNPAGATPKGKGRIWDSTQMNNGNLPGNFLPYIWLGAAERGLCFFADNERGWILDEKNNDPCLTLHRNGDRLTLRVHLIQKSVTIEKPRKIVFGLMASPAKPMRDDWRRILFNAQAPGFESINWAGSTYWGATQTMKETYPIGRDFSVLNKIQETRLTGRESGYERFMNAWSERHLRNYEPDGRKSAEQVRSLARHMLDMTRRRQSTYQNVYWEEFFSVSFHHPETRIFQDEWYGDRKFGFRPSESYIDFQCWYGAEFLRRGIGLYFDNTFPKAASNPHLSTAYRDAEGDIHPSARMWWHRQYMKRIWVLHKQLAPAKTKPIMMFHMTNSHMLPYMSFGQSNLDLEWKYGPKPAQRKFSPDLLRAESIGYQTGNIPLALSKTEPLSGKPVSERRTKIAVRTYAGVYMVHEIRNKYLDSLPFWNNIVEFGYGAKGVEVVNYWDQKSPIVSRDSRCKYLLLQREKTALLLLTTWRGSASEARFAIDTEALGFTPSKIVDVEHPDKDQLTQEIQGAFKGMDGGGELSTEIEQANEKTDKHTAGEWQGPAKLKNGGEALRVRLAPYGVRLLRLES